MFLHHMRGIMFKHRTEHARETTFNRFNILEIKTLLLKKTLQREKRCNSASGLYMRDRDDIIQHIQFCVMHI